jgi:hypothetical protein
MAKNTIAAGRQVRFDPFAHVVGYGVDECRGMVTGTIAKVYPKHKWFSVVYGNPLQRISFKFCDVGERVTFVG